MLTKYLYEQADSSTHENLHAIELVKKRQSKSPTTRDIAEHVRAISFSPLKKLTVLTKAVFETSPKVFWTHKTNLYNSRYRVECETPTYLLSKVLPPEMLSAKQAPKKIVQRKRKKADDPDSDGEAPTTQKTSKGARQVGQAEGLIDQDTFVTSHDTVNGFKFTTTASTY